MAKSVFYSFHYERDVHRVQLVRNINALEGQSLLNSQKWEQIRQSGDRAVESWIAQEMTYKRAVIVLIGRETANRKWVQYEIEKAWADRKPLLGVHIHGLSSMGTTDTKGASPFNSAAGIPIFDPTVIGWDGKIDSQRTYGKLMESLESWSNQGKVRP